MSRIRLPLLLGVAHGVADGAAGWLLGRLSHSMALEQVALLVLMYNVLAFGGQPLAGLIADRLARPRAVALLGLLLLSAALLTADLPKFAVLLAGLGSAAFHVGGGALAFCATPGRAAGPGVFAAPGVIGLAAGGLLAVSGVNALWLLLLPLVLLMLAVVLCELPVLPYTEPAAHSALPDRHDLIMLVLLVGIALRSLVWNIAQMLVEGQHEQLLLLAFGAACGKIVGGWLADRVGWRRWTLSALLVAAPLLFFGGRSLPVLVLGVALLQSASPAALAMTWRLLPSQPALAAGLALGLAIAIGGVPTLLGSAVLLSTPALLLGSLLAAALALWWALPRRTARAVPVAHPPDPLTRGGAL